MNDLDALFPDDSPRDRPATPPPAPAASADLDRLVGPPPAPARERRVHREVEALASVVGERGAIDQTTPAGWTAPDSALAGSRPTHLLGASGRVSRLSVVVAVLAIVAVVAAVSLGVYRQLTANPVDAAMSSLVESEAQVQNELQGIRTAADLYTQTADEAESLVARAADVLAALDGKVDAGVLSATTGARDALAATVTPRTSIEVPVYDRGVIDTSSLTAVARATDRVQAQREGLPALLSQVRADRSAVAQAIGAFQARLDELGQRVVQDVAQELTRNARASRAARDAVSAAATAVAQVRGPQLFEPLSAYAGAVAALRDETDRSLGTPSSPRPTTPSRYVPSTPSSSAAPSPAPTVDPAAPAPTPEASGPPAEPDPLPTGIIDVG